MKLPFTSNKIAAAFGGCCRLNEGDVVLETAEEKEQRDKNLREIFAKSDEEAEERKREKEKQRVKAEEDLKEAKMIFDGDDWKELNDGYTRKYNKINSEGMRYGDKVTELVKMDTPRKCSYSSKTGYECDDDDVYSIVAKETRILKGSTKWWSRRPTKQGAEFNGITPRQLRAVMAMIIRRCEKEEWRDFKGNLLTPDKVTLYEVDRYIIKPFTVETQSSFVQSLPSTAGPQPPRLFVSHWWGETVSDFLECIEQAIIDFRVNYNDNTDSRGGGMTDDTPVWICAYANNQWLLSGDITKDPKESGFTKAMEVAEGRTITILDKEGIVFSRIWCIFELYLTLTNSQVGTAEENSKDGLWAVYTAHLHTYKDSIGDKEEERKALGIISGGATSDGGDSQIISDREAAFPYNLIEKSLSIKVEVAEASVEDDRIHILNSIVGRSIEDIDDVPLGDHGNYVQLNNSLSGTFASSIATLQRASNEDDKGWEKMIKALSNGSTKGEMLFGFGSDGPFGGLTAARATQMVAHLPLTIDECDIWKAGAKYGLEFWDALFERVNQFHNFNKLTINDYNVDGQAVGQEVGVRLAKIMATNTTIKKLELLYTDLIGVDNTEQWGDALMNNNTLTELRLSGVGDDIIEQLKTKTKNRTLELKFDID